MFEKQRSKKNCEFWKSQIEDYRKYYKSWDNLSAADKKEAVRLFKKDSLLQAVKDKKIADYNIANLEKYIVEENKL